MNDNPSNMKTQAEMEAAIASERERCARILESYAEIHAYDSEEEEDLLGVVRKIRGQK